MSKRLGLAVLALALAGAAGAFALTVEPGFGVAAAHGFHTEPWRTRSGETYAHHKVRVEAPSYPTDGPRRKQLVIGTQVAMATSSRYGGLSFAAD